MESLLKSELTGVSIDSRTLREGDLFIAIRGDRFDGHDFVEDAIRKGASGALVERSTLESRSGTFGSLPNIFPVEDTLRALQELSLMHRKKYPLPLVAITGSNGKTTTKEMLAAILQSRGPVLKNEGNLNNHIGVPLTLLRLNPSHQSAVIELGMNNFGEIEMLTRLAMPDVGVITNIGPAHLEFLRSLDGVAEAKGELLATMRSDGAAVLNADDRYFPALRKNYSGRVVSFGIERQADVWAQDISADENGTAMTIRLSGTPIAVRLAVVGRHNVANALAAATAALALNVPADAIRSGLEEFRPLAMRSELRDLRGIRIIADYYNANPASTRAAVEMLAALRRDSHRTIAVLGDMLELGEAGPHEHEEIGEAAGAAGIDVLIVLGALKGHLADGARKAGMPRSRVVTLETVAEAAEKLRELARPGDTVLIKGSRGMKMEKILEEF